MKTKRPMPVCPVFSMYMGLAWSGEDPALPRGCFFQYNPQGAFYDYWSLGMSKWIIGTQD
jgi:hypothetical protein